MSIYRAIVGAAALAYVSAAPVAGAVTHPQFSRVSLSEHETVVRATKRIQMDKSVSSHDKGERKCRRACSNPDRNERPD